MTHPDDLLAAYVDGTLDRDERAAVDGHLAACDRCRDEVRLAGAARRSLAALPRAVDTPAAVGATALDEVRPGAPGRTAAGAVDHPRWARWAGPVAGAAAVVLALALAIPALTGGGDAGTQASLDTGGDGVEGAAAPAAALPTEIERLAGNLADTDLPALVEPVRGLAPGAPRSNDAGTSASPGEGFAEATMAVSAVDAAEECLRTAFPEVTSAPLRVLQFRFDGTPAYAGVYFRRAGDGFDVAVYQVVVASRSGCALLSSSAVVA